MRHCANPECPYRLKFGSAAEYREGFDNCSDCGTPLVDSENTPESASRGSPDAHSGSPRHRVPLSRALITLLGPLVVIATLFIPLPGISEDFRDLLSNARGLPPSTPLTIGAIGLTPFFFAFAIVELVAALIPRWRPLRTSGAMGRAKLAFPVAVLGTVFALLQAFSMARYLSSIGRARSGDSSFDLPALAGDGMSTVLVLVAALVGTSLILVFVSGLITARGIGNGYSIVMLSTGIAQLAPPLGRVWSAFRAERLSFGGVAIEALMIATLVAITRFVTSDEGRARLRVGPTRLPLAGTDPVLVALSVLTPAAALGFGELAGGVVGSLAQFVVLVAATVAGSLLFNRPSHMVDLLTRLDGATTRRSDAIRLVREALPRGVVLSIVFGVLVLFSGTLVRWLGFPVMISGFIVVLVTACARDLVAEWRAWRAHGELVSVWPLHQVYAGDPVVSALTAERIPVFLRGTAVRSLSPFFSPYVPIEVLVPADHAERAFAFLDGRLNELEPAPQAGALAA